jgi:hypothetical protein
MMRGKLSKINPETDNVVAHVHMTFGEKYTSVFYLDEDREIQDFEIFTTAGRRKSKKKATTLAVQVFHSMYENLMDIAFPVRRPKQ